MGEYTQLGKNAHKDGRKILERERLLGVFIWHGYCISMFEMSDMEKTMFITTDDYQKLQGLIDASLQTKSPEIADRLLKELKSARTFPQDQISGNIVTMNSRALLKEINSGRQVEVTITYPEDADPKQQKVSVFSTIGVALLGCREGDITSWRVPGGVGRFKVEKVLYQPEAEGHYSL